MASFRRLIIGLASSLAGGCTYPYFVEKQWNDEQLSCKEIGQQIFEVDHEINRGFWKEWVPAIWNFTWTKTPSNNREVTIASAEKRKARLLALGEARKCGVSLR